MNESTCNMPLYRKAEEIYQALLTITDLFPEDNDYLQHLKSNLV